jgi:hypothetical protein
VSGELNCPLHVTGLMPPGNPPLGTWKATAERNVLPPMLLGTDVVQTPPANVVVAEVAVGSNTTWLLGTLIVYVWLLTLTGNYGEAGALEMYRAQDHLPPVISGHNSYYF